IGIPSMGSGKAIICALPAAMRKRINAAASRMTPADLMKSAVNFMISFLKDEVHQFLGSLEFGINAHRAMRFAGVRVKLHNDAGIEGIFLIFIETVLVVFFAAGVQQYFGTFLE